jgi:hypothetical protein
MNPIEKALVVAAVFLILTAAVLVRLAVLEIRRRK